MTRAVLFDLDGTLGDSDAARDIAIHAADLHAALGRPVPKNWFSEYVRRRPARRRRAGATAAALRGVWLNRRGAAPAPGVETITSLAELPSRLVE
ncbi:MAG: hypothetical protein QOF76_2449 [Solirubrobacteraceae bacterium]|jgi:FMN phosphatase YigB (HAD superfamily)|nr:hypothetical protein [Solirubrobacteraceae bacterium]